MNANIFQLLVEPHKEPNEKYDDLRQAIQRTSYEAIAQYNTIVCAIASTIEIFQSQYHLSGISEYQRSITIAKENPK